MTHTLSRAILERRSWRIFMEDPVAPEDLESIRRVADQALSVNGQRATRVILESDPQRVPGLTAAVGAGFVGKVNLWIRSAPPPAYAVLVGDTEREVVHGPHHLYNVDAAVAGELVALAVADRKLGGCWMAAIHMEAIGRYLELSESERVPAVIALGTAGIRRKGALLASAWDRFTRRGVAADRRKDTAVVCHLDRFGSGETLPTADLEDLPDDGRSLEEVARDAAPSSVFSGRVPSEEKLALLMEAMRRSPSADNAQTWRFVVVRGQDKTAEVLAAAGLDVETPPGVLLATFAAPFIVKNVRKEQPFALIDHPIALTHGYLAAEVLGLAWNATFIFDGGAVRERLGVPENHPPTALFFLDEQGEKATEPYPEWVQLRR